MFGYDDPGGHPEVIYENVRVPADNLLGEEGGGFAISQARLGPGPHPPLHALHRRGRGSPGADGAPSLERTTFGTLVAQKGLVQDWIAESRIEIDMAREYVLRTAYLMDTVGNKAAATEISGIKVAVPQPGLRDHRPGHPGARRRRRHPVHPAGRDVRPQRTLRIADGPDEVHKMTIARREIRKYAPDFRM